MSPTPEIPPDVVVPLLNAGQREILISAAGGSLLSLLFMGEPFTWKQAATAIASGMFCAYFGVEITAGAFHLSAGYYGALGAFYGFSAMAALGGLSKLFRMWRDDPGGFIQRFVPFFRKGGDA